MRFISLIDNPFSRVEPTCPSVRIEIKFFPIVSDGVYWTTLVFEWLFCPEERKLDKPIFKSSNAWGVAQGGDVEASVCVEASV